MSNDRATNSVPSGAARFATTHWSVVLSASRPESAHYQQALESLCQTYWFPLYAYLRRHGYDTHQAEDHTQAFLASLLAKHGLRLAALKHLRSHRLALVGSILALFPFSIGSVVGLPMGIWALVAMRNKQVKAAFGQEHTEVAVPPKVRDVAVSAAGDVKEAFERGKAEVEKIIGQKKAGAEQSSGLPAQSDANTPSKTRGLAIGSFVLGLVSILLAPHAVGFIDKLVLVFPPAFIAIFLGVTAVKRIRTYRDYPLDTGFAIAGIVTASLAGLSLFAHLM